MSDFFSTLGDLLPLAFIACFIGGAFYAFGSLFSAFASLH